MESYVALRRGDTTPGSRVAYRMTVRQLEALIRLSEAIARSYLETQVQPRHVRVAVRLLKTSIISVESTEIDLSEFQEGNSDGSDDRNNNFGQADVHPASESEGTTNQQKEEYRVKEDYFQRVTQALVMRLRQHEEAVRQEETGLAGMSQGDLIQWYVNQQNEKNNYSSTAEVEIEIKRIRSLIERLIRREGHLIVIDDGRQEGGEGAAARSARDTRILAVAPNYAMD